MIRLFTFSIFFIFSFFLYAEDSRYELGKGIQIGTLPLYIGGYFSLEYEHIDSENYSLKLDDIAILAYGNYNSLSYMIELEAEDIYTDIKSNERYIKDNQVHIERLYFTYEFNENYALSMGKYNSPIGFWNLVPINVLRDTTSSPIISKLLFPNFTSGLDVAYSSQDDTQYNVHLMIQEREDIDNWINDEIYNNFELNRHYGLGIGLEDNSVSYQFNMGYFRTVTDESHYYLLGAFQYLHPKFKLLAEIGTQFDDDGTNIPYIAYFQWSQKLEENHEVIFRAESYKDNQTDIEDNFLLLGYTYRPLAPVAFKAEYQLHSLHEENILLFSVSVLF